MKLHCLQLQNFPAYYLLFVSCLMLSNCSRKNQNRERNSWRNVMVSLEKNYTFVLKYKILMNIALSRVWLQYTVPQSLWRCVTSIFPTHICISTNPVAWDKSAQPWLHPPPQFCCLKVAWTLNAQIPGWSTRQFMEDNFTLLQGICCVPGIPDLSHFKFLQPGLLAHPLCKIIPLSQIITAE